jgi:Amt family ammonium transporter
LALNYSLVNYACGHHTPQGGEMRIRWSTFAVPAVFGLLWTGRAAAAEPIGVDTATLLPLVMTGLALLVPVGLTLLVAGGLPPEQARQSTLTLLAALGLGMLAYWAVGFALHFGGIGLIDSRAGYDELIWEWTALSERWGTGWGMLGLSGFALQNAGATADAYLLFASRLPWIVTATLIPLLALRGRAPAPVTLVAGLLLGGFLAPIAGNWSSGGGWLANLGTNLNLGHGYVDLGDVGPAFLVGAAAALAGILVFVPRRPRTVAGEPVPLPEVHLPLLTVTGAGLLLIGAAGWALANPRLDWQTIPPALVLVNVLLAGAGGALVPIAYTWFASGAVSPLFAARGLAAGVLVGLVAGGFVPPWAALLAGALSGLLAVLTAYVIEHLLRLDDPTGSVSIWSVGTALGLLTVAFLADGRFGQGWNGVGALTYLGVPGQGVSGLWPAAGFQPDWPGQMEAQLIGLAAYALTSFLVATLVFWPVGLVVRLWRRG